MLFDFFTKEYQWVGINVAGMRETGNIAAQNSIEVKKILSSKNIFPIKISVKLKILINKIPSRVISDFTRQLATLIDAGVPLLNCFNIIGRGVSNKNMQKLIDAMGRDLKQGKSLTEAFRKHNKFDELFCSLIYVGEQSGTLDSVLNDLADHKEKIEKLKLKIKKALFYPAAVLLTAIIITILLLIFVIPQFNELFNGFGAKLPLYTQLIIKISEFIRHNWMLGVIFLFVAIGFIRIIVKSSSKLMNFVDSLVLKVPFVGNLLTKAIIVRITKTLAITLDAGLPLSKALTVVSKVANNNSFSIAITKIQQQIITGKSLTKAIAHSMIFPQRAMQMIAIGEESGDLSLMLSKVSQAYEMEVNYIITNLNNLLEPLIMVILGVFIGGIVIGMYLPIFKLGTII